MRFNFLLVITLIGLSSFSYGKGGGAEKCPTDANDPLAQEIRVPGGPYQGRCINSHNYRSVRSLSEDELKLFNITTNEEEFVVGNFRHLNKFWIARIPIKNIERVVFQKMNIIKGTPIYHGQLRFLLKDKAVTLTSQVADPESRKTIELREASGKPQDFIIALFGARDIQNDLAAFNPIMGINTFGGSKYSVSYAFQSLYDGAQWALDNKLSVQEFSLDLSTESQQNLLFITRALGDKNGISEMYDLFTNNCLNFAFTLLNNVVTETSDTRITKRMSESMKPISQLKKLGLIESKKDFQKLELEYPQGIQKIE